MKQQHSHHNIWGSKFHLLPMLCAVLLLLAGSCTDHNGLDHEEKKITFSLDLSKGFAPSTYSLTDHDEKLVSTIDVLVFDNNDKYFSGPHYGLISGNQVTVGLPDDVDTDYTIAVFGNSRTEVKTVISGIFGGSPSKSTIFEKIIYTHTDKWNTTPGSTGYKSIPMYGELKKSELSSKSVSMIRTLARVNVSLTGSALSKFTMNTVHLANYNTKGHVASIASPGNVEVPDAAQVTGIDDALLYDNVSNNAIKQDIYTFEAKAGSPDAITTNPCIIIGGTYHGAFEDVACYYRIDFVDYQTGNYLPIQRNYSYDVVINSISNPGFGDIEEAFASPGSNISPNLHYTITPWTENTEVATNCNGMNEIITSASLLEFDSAARGSGNGDNILFVQTDHREGWTAEIEYKNGSGWLSLLNMNGDPVTTCADLSSSNYPFQLSTPSPIKLKMSANNGGSSRTAIVKFKAGNVTYPVEVVQSNVATVYDEYQPEAGSYSLYTPERIYIPVSRANAGNTIKLSSTDVFTAELSSGSTNTIKKVELVGEGLGAHIYVEFGAVGGNAEVSIKKNGEIDPIYTWDITVIEPVIESRKANSYIVAPNSGILLPVGIANDTGADVLGTQLNSGDAYTVGLVWTDNANGISPESNIRTLLPYGTGGDGQFFVRTGSGEGNAVVAIKKGETILWSWHIWVTANAPQAQGASADDGRAFMDRNLGALNNGFENNLFAGTLSVNAQTIGLMYQWGRKDPFPGSATLATASQPFIYYGSFGTTGKSGNQQYSIITQSGPQSFSYVIQNPDKFISGSNDWCSDNSDGKNLTDLSERWGVTGGMNGSYTATKSVYDPCPPGWRVPRNGSWNDTKGDGKSGWLNAVSNNIQRNDKFGGVYPAAGYRSDNSGASTIVGTDGYFWSAAPSSANAYDASFLNFFPGMIPPSARSRAAAHTLRCLQDREAP